MSRSLGFMYSRALGFSGFGFFGSGLGLLGLRLGSAEVWLTSNETPGRAVMIKPQSCSLQRCTVWRGARRIALSFTSPKPVQSRTMFGLCANANSKSPKPKTQRLES